MYKIYTNFNHRASIDFAYKWRWVIEVEWIALNRNADVARPDKISGADINSICQEVSKKRQHIFNDLFIYIFNCGYIVFCFVILCLQAGMLAVRENRYIVLAKDFEKAYKTVIKKDEQEHEFYK